LRHANSGNVNPSVQCSTLMRQTDTDIASRAD